MYGKCRYVQINEYEYIYYLKFIMMNVVKHTKHNKSKQTKIYLLEFIWTEIF